MDISRPHVLIVEDSEDDQTMYAYHLIRDGYRVTGANDGLDGLGKAFYLSPDLILLDLWLPRMSGWELMLRLKGDERTKSIPVLAVTGHTAAIPRECNGFLTKPLSLDQLSEEIAHSLHATKSPPPQAL
jgi:two-component system, cell cycle response regulator DivK